MTSPAQTGPTLTRRHQWRVPAALVLVLALAAFANSFPAHYHIDDNPVVRQNPLVSDPDFFRICTSDYCGENANSGNYRPVTVLSYAAVHGLLGTGANGHHAANVLLHAANSVLLLALFLQLGVPVPAATLAAALFAVHPIHTEVLNEVVGRSELLALFFFLGALLAANARKRAVALLAVPLFALALLSKENAVTLVVLMPLVDAFTGRLTKGTRRRRVLLYLALLCVTAGWFWVRHLVAAASPVPPDARYPTDNPLPFLPLVSRPLTAFKIQILYLARLLLPVRLQGIYVSSQVGAVPGLFSAWTLAAATGSAALAGLLARGWRRRSFITLGVLFYLTTFAVTSNLIVPTYALFAERYAYMPSAGFALAVAILATTIPSVKRRRFGLLAVSLLLVAPLMTRTWVRNADFTDPVRLWQKDIAADPANVRAWYFLAGALENRGDLEMAESALRNGIAADPAFPDIYTNLSWLLLELGRPAEALKTARMARENTPHGTLPWGFPSAAAYLELGNPEQALHWIERVEPFYFWDPLLWKIKGRALAETGQTASAVEALERSLELGGDQETALALGRLLLESERFSDAQKVLRPVAEVTGNAVAANLVGVALALQGRQEKAAAWFARALASDPGNPHYRDNLERARSGQGPAGKAPD